ncbi:DUF1761 domain-containing protein [Amylibacter sp. IMCC11727]|uniref:DUF1761 domain-containing protein n=1 Tax=Amylibacter sp. IMCC11727 TaxID=3039851 RepID=UPI00244DBDEB|nr:DUF1761 domain-containing protein [Amylibacter sp. IMCC11727]WGI21984.1 DUF1761 domain-containing protein [Amylibacter sp. IMCC11727]
MEFVAVIVAGLAAFAWGAVWYSVMAKPWMAANGLTEDTINRSNPVPYVISLVAVILVAGMTRHIFVTSGVDTVWLGGVSGFGLGLFIAVPWLATNYGFAQRPFALTLIDGMYSTVGCTVIGIVLTLF